MASEQHSDRDFIPVAEVEIDSAEPQRAGFVLRGLGKDAAEYRLDMHLDMPVDQRTQAVLGEILSQSEWRIWRRAPRTLRSRQQDRTQTPSR